MLATEPVRAGSGADEVASLFDEESEGYDSAHEGPRAHLMKRRMEVVLEALGPGPGNVLDAGMGPGRLLAELTRRGWTVSGVDISERMVALAAARLPDARGRLVQASVTELPFDDASFDAVAATGVIEYLDHPTAGIGELLRVLRPGGVAVVSMPNLSSVQVRWTGLWYPSVRAAKRALPCLASRPAPYAKPGLTRVPQLVQMITTAGASSVSVRHTGVTVLPGPFDRAVPGLSRRLARRLEDRPGRATRVLAAQVVAVARKPGQAGP